MYNDRPKRRSIRNNKGKIDVKTHKKETNKRHFFSQIIQKNKGTNYSHWREISETNLGNQSRKPISETNLGNQSR